MKYKAIYVKTLNSINLSRAIEAKALSLGYKFCGGIGNSDLCRPTFCMNQDGTYGFTRHKELGLSESWTTIEELMAMTPKDVQIPEIAEGHNPDQLTEEEVGVAEGWRLLEPEEIADREMTCDIQGWSFAGWNNTDAGRYEFITYRTKKPKGYFLREEREVTWDSILRKQSEETLNKMKAKAEAKMQAEPTSICFVEKAIDSLPWDLNPDRSSVERLIEHDNQVIELTALLNEALELRKIILTSLKKQLDRKTK